MTIRTRLRLTVLGLMTLAALAGAGCEGGVTPSPRTPSAPSSSATSPTTTSPPASSPPASPTSTPTGSATANGPGAGSTEHPDAPEITTVDLREPAGMATLASRLPAQIGYPPRRSRPLLEDPPARAVVQTMVWRPYTEIDGWNDLTTYFYGVDGRWRSLTMSELGLPESRIATSDSGWAGRLSPDGRRWVFPTGSPDTDGEFGPVGVMDLRTGKINYLWPDHGKREVINPVWVTPRLLAFHWGQGKKSVRALVDVESGKVRRSRPGYDWSSRNLARAGDGTVLQVLRAEQEPAAGATLAEYEADLRLIDRRPIPFPVGDDYWAPVAATDDRIAIATTRTRVRGFRGGPAIVVADRSSLQPIAVLTGKGLSQSWSEMAWLDQNTLLLPSAGYTGGKAPVLAWQIDQGRVVRLSNLVAAKNDAVVGQFASTAVR